MERVISENGVRIAYDVCGGVGPLLLLAHGFSTDRRIWQTTDILDLLTPHFRVVTLDLRGCGESDRPLDPASYGIDAHLADILAVADACNAHSFFYFGWSFGATIGLHLACRSARLSRAVIAGTVFGRVLSPERSQALVAEGEALLAAQARGQLETLSPEQQAFVARTDLAVWLARQHGFATWPGVEPAEVVRPIFVYTGTADEPVVTRMAAYRAAMRAVGIPYRVFDGLNHWQLVAAVEDVAPWIVACLSGASPG